MNQEVFDTCAERQLCMIAFLPHILDSTAAGRNGYIELLLNIAERYKQRPFGYEIAIRRWQFYPLCNIDGCGLKEGKILIWNRTWM